jgi:hypothetical protein
MLGCLVVEDCVVHLLVVESVSEVEGHPIVVHIFQQSKHVAIAAQNDLQTVVFDYLRKSDKAIIYMYLQGLVCDFRCQKYFSVYFVHIIQID